MDDREIHYCISKIDDLPPLPGALQRLMEIIHDEVASPRELESLILYDQSLSARILRIANSTYYGRRGEVRTISKAVLNLGFEKVKSICLCALLMEMFADNRALSRAQREALWKHAFATARIAREMATRRPWLDKEDAYLLGLLHDIGRVLMAVYFSDHYQTVEALAHKRKLPPWCVEFHYGLLHTEVGKWAALRWGFHESLQRVIEFHHMPGKSTSYAPEVKTIYLANVLANSREYPELVDDPCTLACCKDLYISEEEWDGYRGALSDIWLEVDQLWNLLG
jgi:putative nucleotidyltransferase with HDIG domain